MNPERKPIEEAEPGVGPSRLAPEPEGNSMPLLESNVGTPRRRNNWRDFDCTFPDEEKLISCRMVMYSSVGVPKSVSIRNKRASGDSTRIIWPSKSDVLPRETTLRITAWANSDTPPPWATLATRSGIRPLRCNS